MAETPRPHSSENSSQASENEADKNRSQSEAKKAKEAEHRAKEKEEEKKEKVKKEKKTTQGKETKRSSFTIPFLQAEYFASLVVPFQNGEGLVVSKEIVSDLKENIEPYLNGLSDEHISEVIAKNTSEMSEDDIAELYVAAQQLLREAKVLEPNEGDIQTKDDPDFRKLETVSRKAVILQARSTSEETLTVIKVKKHLTIDDDLKGREHKKSGPGAQRKGSWVDDMPDVSTLPDNEEGKILSRHIKQAKTIAENNPGDEFSLRDTQRLGMIEESLDEKILNGELDAEDPNVKKVREVLRDKIGELQDLYRKTQTREVASAEDLLEYTIATKKLIEDLMVIASSGDPNYEQTSEWVSGKAQLENILKAADGAVLNKVNYRLVFEVDKAVVESELRYRRVRNLFDKIVEPSYLVKYTSRDRSLRNIDIFDKHFNAIYEDLTPDEKNSYVGDINEKANTYYHQVTSGYGRGLEEAALDLLKGVDAKPDAVGLEGLREWRTMKSFKRLENQVRFRQLLSLPVVWEDVPEHVSNIFNFIEDAGVSVEELGPMIQESLNIIRSIPADSEHAKEVRKQMTKRLEAFKAWHILMLTMVKTDMNPEQMANVVKEHFEGRVDETFEYFLKRFSEDPHGRRLVASKDENGNHLTPDKFSDLNVFDIAFRLYNEQLRDERIQMNMIEEMSKYTLTRDLTPSEIRQIKDNVGFDRLPPEWKSKWDSEFKTLRDWLKNEMGGNINNWGKFDEGLKNVGDMAEVVEKWHTTKTLHGAYGTILEKDLASIAAELGVDIKDANKVNEVREKYLGKSFLEFRRNLILEKLKNELTASGLKIEIGRGLNGSVFEDADLNLLDDVGYLGSVDENAFNLTWMMSWSNYDNIRLYTDRKTKYDDDYDYVVHHNSSSIFFGRAIDHTWEFFHHSAENRGRAKIDDINIIYKQIYPGKHHYLFPQNTMMVGFIEQFLTDEQKNRVNERTEELYRDKKYGFSFSGNKYKKEFIGWMKGVVLMDMVENGEVFLGQRLNFVDKAGNRATTSTLTEVAAKKKFTEFSLNDKFGDRAKHLAFTSVDNMQDYLTNPSEGRFLKLLNRAKVFYSTRLARALPFATLHWRAHREIAEHQMLEQFNEANMTSSSAEQLLHGMVEDGMMLKEQGEHEKRQLGFKEIKLGGSWGIPEMGVVQVGEFFGTVPFRRFRNFLETTRRISWDSRFLGITAIFLGLIEGFKEYFKRLNKEIEK